MGFLRQAGIEAPSGLPAQWRGEMQRYPLSLCLLCESPPESVRAVRDAYPDAQRATEIVADYQNHGLGLGFKSQSGAPPY